MHSQGPGPILAKVKNPDGLSSETRTVIELRERVESSRERECCSLCARKQLPSTMSALHSHRVWPGWVGAEIGCFCRSRDRMFLVLQDCGGLGQTNW